MHWQAEFAVHAEMRQADQQIMADNIMRAAFRFDAESIPPQYAKNLLLFN